MDFKIYLPDGMIRLSNTKKGIRAEITSNTGSIVYEGTWTHAVAKHLAVALNNISGTGINLCGLCASECPLGYEVCDSCREALEAEKKE